MNSLSNTVQTHTSPSADTVEIMEFGDFTCSRCRAIRGLLNSVFNAFTGHLTYTYCYFPHYRCDSSTLAAIAAEAARRQGYFWPLSKALFALSIINRTTLSNLADNLGLNHKQFIDDLDNEQVRLCIETDQREGYRLGVTKTPTLFVNGQQFHGKLTQARLMSIISSHLTCSTRPILSKVDSTSGMIYWGKGEWG